jgi:hypothetical protein
MYTHTTTHTCSGQGRRSLSPSHHLTLSPSLPLSTYVSLSSSLTLSPYVSASLPQTPSLSYTHTHTNTRAADKAVAGSPNSEVCGAATVGKV